MANSQFFARHGLSANGQTTISGSNGQISVGGNVTINTSTVTVGTSTIANNTGVYTGVVNSTSVNTSTVTVGSSLDVTGTVTTAKANVVSQTLTDQATIAWNTALGQIATVTLGGNRTFGAPTNLKVGSYILHVVQDGTGSRTITTWNSVFKWPGGVAPTLTTTASARDVFSFICDGTNLYGSFLPDVK